MSMSFFIYFFLIIKVARLKMTHIFRYSLDNKQKFVSSFIFLKLSTQRDFPSILRFLDSSVIFMRFKKQVRLNALQYVKYKIKKD